MPGFRSDHACVTLSIQKEEETRGRGFWKFNCRLLKDGNLKNQLIQTIEETSRINKDADSCLLWDTIKCCMRGICIGYAAKKKRESKKQLDDLNKEAKQTEDNLCEAVTNKDPLEVIQNIEENLEEIKRKIEGHIKEETRGQALRSKCEWYEHGDKSSKFFLTLEKSHSNKKTVSKWYRNDKWK